MPLPIEYKLATAMDVDTIIQYRMLLLDTLSGKQHPQHIVRQLKADLNSYFPSALADGSYVSWIAYCNDEVVAIAGMTIYSRPASYKCPTGKVGYILNMYTAPEYRRHGICKALLDKLADSAREKGVSTLFLHASPDGEFVYRNYGFIEPFSPVLEYKL